MAALSGKDLFMEGDLAAVLFGQPLSVDRLTVNGVDSKGSLINTYQLEAFYRFRVSKNISITPGVFFVFNPGNSSANGTATVGVIRTTFSF
jgi:carbohydrate-selective porin OprB